MQSITYVLALSILATLPSGIYSSCEISDRGKNEHDICVADVQCNIDVNNLDKKLDGWSCGRTEYREWDNYYGRYRYNTKLSNNYNINLILSDINSNEDTFRILSNSLAQHVIKLEAKNNNMLNMPSQIHAFSQVTDIDLSNNNVEIIDLSKFIQLSELKTLILSHNAISTLAVDSEDSALSTSGITVIDLSYNLIETIPNNYFLRFTQLQYLDISYNFINSFNMITFEGIMKLQTLYMSHNHLNSLGYTLSRFVNLIELNIDQNNISSILEPNFIGMSKLQKLNLSSNQINHIDNKAFQNLVHLVQLDLGYNKIDMIKKELLINNSKLQSLSLSHNKIEQIETGAFENKVITDFQFDDNRIMTTIERRTFQGIYINIFNLSRSQIKTLGPDAFSAMNSTLVSLNLSCNSLHNISKSSFRSLNLLTELDLSNNNLSDVDLETNDLKNLTLLLLQNNNIQKIRRNTFSNLTSLTMLDLSFNSINEIEKQSFDELKKIEILILKHNALVYTIEAHTFKGLISLKTIDIMNTNIKTYENDVFSDTKFLKQLNSSHGQLSFIGFNVLKRCDSLVILDFSNNMLENFNINTTTIATVNEIYLNNNKIRKVTNKTFAGLSSLKMLHLFNNKIIDLEPKAFHNLHNLMHLYLFSNPDMKISDTSFNNLTLTDLSLEYIKNNFNFQYITNASIANLMLQQCGIVNISTVFVFKITNVQKLNLRLNEIAILDKSSFQNMPYLSWLDLSFNKITFIQPGSFMNTNMINFLDLTSNYLQSLQYGVLDGLKNIRQLNLSNNAMHSFGANLLHNTPFIENIYLDNNAIQTVNFHDFVATGVKSFSIGGNPISCDTFVKLKKEIFNHFNVTTQKVNFNSENVDGITCRTVYNNTKEIDQIVSQNSTDTIGKVLAKLSNSIENLRVSIAISNNKTGSNESFAIKDLISMVSDVRDVIVKLDESFTNATNGLRSNFTWALDKFIETSKESQILNDKYMNRLVDVHNKTRFYIENLYEIIRNKSFGSEVNADDGKIQLKQFEESLSRMIIRERNALRNEINGSVHNIQNNSFNGKQIDGQILKEVKITLYFISVCLAFILICVMYKSFTVKKRFTQNKIHSSSQPIANDMELE